MANFVSGAELSTAIGVDAYNGITDNADETVLAQLLNLADSEVLSALRRSGYGSISVATLSGYTTADQYLVKSMAIRVACRIGCGRRGVRVEQTLPAWVLPEDFYDGKLRLPDTAPDYTGARGGILIADSGTESDSTTSRGTTFGMNKTGGYP